MENKITYEKDYVTRINLKTDTNQREKLIDFCLHDKNQFLAIGWSCVDFKTDDYSAFYDTVVAYVHGQKRRLNPALNIFKDACVNDLFWTRDLNGVYWICRVTESAKAYLNKDLDIGAVLPVKAYAFGLEVPGQIKASFNRSRGGIVERLKDSTIIEYSKYVYNKLSKKDYYEVNLNIANNIIDNLPAFELEELVISYIQIVEGYYLLSNSIANKSTTVKIECQFISRDINNVKKAVVQVKAKQATALDALSFKAYEDKGYYIYLYAPNIENMEKMKNVIKITPKELQDFYGKYKAILPESITQFENLFDIGFGE
mgnify:FL=1